MIGMAKVTESTWVVGENGAPKFLDKGTDVPAWAADQVGGHLLDESEPTAYRDQKMGDLKVEIERRNADRPEDQRINPEGRASIESYAVALEADDAAQAEPPDQGGGGESEPGSGGGGNPAPPAGGGE